MEQFKVTQNLPKMRGVKMNSQNLSENISVLTDDHILVEKCIPNIRAAGVPLEKMSECFLKILVQKRGSAGTKLTVAWGKCS